MILRYTNISFIEGDVESVLNYSTNANQFTQKSCLPNDLRSNLYNWAKNQFNKPVYFGSEVYF